jgi:prophage antirepressor-like protein
MDNKSNLPVVFNFGTQSIRTIDKDGEVWFIANDVCKVLDITNPRNATARLDDDERGVHSMDTRSSSDVVQDREMTIISESGLYSLVLSSRKEQARAFKRWITHEVLPAIRKTGGYQQPVNMAHALEAANAVAAQVQAVVFEQLLSGGKRWQNERWMLSFNYGRNNVVTPHASQIASEAVVMSLDELAKAIAEEGGMLVASAELAHLAAACSKRLAQRLEYQASKQTNVKTV